jgi:hypothetical protein
LVECEVFPRNEHGKVKGELHYDPESGCLVADTAAPAGGRTRRSTGCSTDGSTVRASRSASYQQHANWHKSASGESTIG